MEGNNQYSGLAKQYGEQYGVDPALIMAVMETESSFNPDAFLADSNGGSYGLMQMDYPTAQDRGYSGSPDGLYDPATNVQLGTSQLAWLYRELGDWNQVIEAYNEGLGNVRKGVQDLTYLGRVSARWTKWQAVLGS